MRTRLACEFWRRARTGVKHESGDKAPLFKVIFAERRSVVYELFLQIVGLE